MIQHHDLDAFFILRQLGHIGLIFPERKKQNIFSMYFYLPFIWESLFELEFLILILFHASVSLGSASMATHSSILAWRIPWTEEPGGLQSTGSQRVGYN